MKNQNHKKNVILSETRVWMEDGEVKTRDLVFESECTDLTPHPTECRVVFVNGESKIIWPAPIYETGTIDNLKMGEEALIIALKKDYDYILS